MTIFCILLSPMMSYITLRANSVIAAAVFHGTLNGTSGLALMVVHGGDDLTIGVTGLAGLAVLGLGQYRTAAGDKNRFELEPAPSGGTAARWCLPTWAYSFWDRK